ncbi:MAG: AAA family ATPase [Gammaproteobacteria bacterium]|nr:AAA family ATPase [Gammaproteobacteria bacterium]
MDIQHFFEEQRHLMARLSEKRRYLYEHIHWNERCLGILGSRGTGKTTLMLQHIKECYTLETEKALYISVDSPFFQAHDLFQFAKTFHQLGGELLCIDEVHKYPEWSIHIKSIYDSLPDLKVIFSGSSLLQVSQQKSDLSRRAIIFYLHGLSFREYLNFSLQAAYPVWSLETILSEHPRLATQLSLDIKILHHFKNYLKTGYYPFFLEGKDLYLFKVAEVIKHILEVDLPIVNRIEPRQISKIKKLLYLLATTVPFVPNISKLSEATNISRPQLYEYLEKLQDARLLNLVREPGRGYDILTKPEKIFLENSNLMFSITNEVNLGSLRELFFVNQLRNSSTLHPSIIHDAVETSAQGDFMMNGKYLFEIGGKKKNFQQLKNIENSFVVADDIEVGFKNKIPLWLFGFLY